MRGFVQRVEEEGPKVPSYIVTFSDMVTLLLTFFVMLLSLAQKQDSSSFKKGRESFIMSLRYMGLGMLSGHEVRPDFGHEKTRHYIDNPNSPVRGRTIDAREDEALEIFRSLNQSMEAIPSQLVAKTTNFSLSNIRFGGGSSVLDNSAKEFLTGFCRDLMQDPDSRAIKLYILGIANEAGSEKERWLLSAKRAGEVVYYMKKSCGASWPIVWWGAGSGGRWVQGNSPISKKSQISIAVLRSK